MLESMRAATQGVVGRAIMTIVLGRVLRGNRATRVQLLGVGVALTGAVLLGAAAR